MSKKDLTAKALDLKYFMGFRRIACATVTDLVKLLQCHDNDDYTPMQETNLYKGHGPEYCEYLEMLNSGKY